MLPGRMFETVGLRPLVVPVGAYMVIGAMLPGLEVTLSSVASRVCSLVTWRSRIHSGRYAGQNWLQTFSWGTACRRLPIKTFQVLARSTRPPRCALIIRAIVIYSGTRVEWEWRHYRQYRLHGSRQSMVPCFGRRRGCGRARILRSWNENTTLLRCTSVASRRSIHVLQCLTSAVNRDISNLRQIVLIVA